MKALSASEIAIVCAVYVIVILVAMFITWTRFANSFWKLFNATSFRLMSVILLAVSAASITLFYNDWIAYFAVPLMFLFAIVVPFFDMGAKVSSGWGVMLCTLLLMIAASAFGITTWFREEISDGGAALVGTLVGLFWLGGLFATLIIGPFREFAQPFTHTRTLLLMLTLTFYTFWFITKDYGALAVSLLGILAMIIWLIKGDGKVLSAALETYQKNHYETAFIVVTLVFIVTLNLAVGAKKKTNESAKYAYLFSIILFALAIAVLLSIATFATLKNWNPPSHDYSRESVQLDTNNSAQQQKLKKIN